ncbi:MAG: hypothetical protein JW942_02980 [Opitutales bacterium]|nr:hypothetical protein [Opitutales bacterium]
MKSPLPLLCFLLASSLFLPMSAQAQDVAAREQSLARNLDELLERYCAANGGRETINSVRSLRVEAVLSTADGQSGTMIFIKQKPNFIRTSWHSNNGVIISKGFNGTQAWEHVSFPNGDERYSFISKVPRDVFEWVLADPEGCGATLEMLPIERDGSRELYHVRASFAATGFVCDYWLDAVSLCEVRVRERDADGTETESIVEKPFRQDGIWFPGVQREVLPDGSSGNVVEVKDVQMNIGLLHCFFDPPKELVDAAKKAEADIPAPTL